MRDYQVSPDEWRNLSVTYTNDQLLIGDFQVMQTWERPIMEFMAREVTFNHGDILEIGFGLGVSAQAIINNGCRSYTVIEAHPVVAEKARAWAASIDQIDDISVIEGFWQDIIPSIHTQFDGILFDTYSLSSTEFDKNHFPFISMSPRLLKPNGVLTYYSDEDFRFRSEHLELIFKNFEEVKLKAIYGLIPPPDCEYWSHPHMVIPVCRGPIYDFKILECE